MNDGVQMAYAREEGTDTYVHISEDVGRRKLVCPECGERVTKRAGQIRRHHFAHSPGSKCSISYETNLHIGAKVYLANKLRKNEDVEILVTNEMLPEGVLKEVMRKACIPRFQIPMHILCNNILCQHELEHSLGNYVVDVLSKDHQGARMAWEICVSHAIEPEKLEYFRTHHIPFIELEPSEKGEVDYIFDVRQIGNVDMIDPQDFTLKSLFHLFQDELNRRYAPGILKNFLDNADQILTDCLFARLEGSVNPKIQTVSLLQQVREFLQSPVKVSAEQTVAKDLTGEAWVEPVKTMDLVSSKYGPTIRFNDKAFISSPMSFSGELLKVMGDNFDLMGDVNTEKEIIGLRMNCFTSDLKEHRLEVRISKPGTWKGIVSLSYLLFGRINNRPVWRFSLPEDAGENDELEAKLSSPNELVFMLLGFLQEHGQLVVSMKRGKNQHPFVYGIEISGIYSPKAFQMTMLHNIVDHFKYVLFE